MDPASKGPPLPGGDGGGGGGGGGGAPHVRRLRTLKRRKEEKESKWDNTARYMPFKGQSINWTQPMFQDEQREAWKSSWVDCLQ